MSDEQPDITEDPRDQDVAEGGYPETNPEGSTPEPDEGRSGGDTGSDAPSPSTSKEADRAQTTGNPNAAG